MGAQERGIFQNNNSTAKAKVYYCFVNISIFTVEGNFYDAILVYWLKLIFSISVSTWNLSVITIKKWKMLW